MKGQPMHKRQIIRVLLAVYSMLFLFTVFSLSVPPHDLILFVAFFLIAVVGFLMARAEGRSWKLIWIVALTIAILGGLLEILAGKRLAEHRAEIGVKTLELAVKGH